MSAMLVARASPRCELCAQTTARGVRWERPAWSSRPSSVVIMCRSRTFQDSAPPRNIGAVVDFGITDDPRVLFGDEVLVGGDASVTLGVLCCPPSQIDELLHDFVFARAFDVQTGGVAVSATSSPKASKQA